MPGPTNTSTPSAVSARLAYDEQSMDPVVETVIAIEPLPVDAPGSRRALVRWSDGTTGEALRWYDDEVLFSEGDLIGKTAADLRTLHFARDRQFLRDEQG